MAKKKPVAEQSQESPQVDAYLGLPPENVTLTNIGGETLVDIKDAGGINRIPSAQFLVDSGLLFEINRTLLHPLGLALEVVVDEKGNAHLGDLWDYRHDNEGMLYDPAAFAHGCAKHNSLMNEWGYDAHQKRKAALGFVVQEK